MQPYIGVSYAGINEQMYITKHQNELCFVCFSWILRHFVFLGAIPIPIIGRHKSDTDVLADISLSEIGL